MTADPDAASPCDPWASTGDGLTPDERLSLAHRSGIEVGRLATASPGLDVERWAEVLHARHRIKGSPAGAMECCGGQARKDAREYAALAADRETPA
jgi:hypothetical protein